MSSRRKRKKPLPDWVGEAYNTDASDETKVNVEPVNRPDLENTEKSSVKSASGASYSRHQNFHLNQSGGKVPRSDAKSGGKSDKDAPLSAEEIIRLSLPLLKFNGSLIYSYNSSDCSVLCDDLMSQLAPEDTWHVGVDMEWPVTYTAGQTKKIALIQICRAEDKCYLFHIAAMGTLPKPLKNLLTSNQVIKYGINIEGDFWKLERDFDIQVRNVIKESVKELGKIANVKLKSTERWTLDGLTRNVLRKRLDKEEAVRCGSWDQYPLSEEQIQYAAADAYASFLLANQLRDK